MRDLARTSRAAPARTRGARIAHAVERGWGKPAQPHTGEDGEGAIEITVRHITEGKNDRS